MLIIATSGKREIPWLHRFLALMSERREANHSLPETIYPEGGQQWIRYVEKAVRQLMEEISSRRCAGDVHADPCKSLVCSLREQ